MYYTLDKRPKVRSSEPGDKYLDIFQEEITKNGDKNLIAIGKRNIWDMIQKDKESTEIENILIAMKNGDFSALRKEEPIYIDATTMPKNLMEAQNIVLKAKQEFEKFPIEVKREFDYSPEKYVSEMGTKESLEKLSPYIDKMKEIKKAGSVKEYEKKVAEAAKFAKDVEIAKGANNEPKQ